MSRKFISSESIFEGHPDNVCDVVSDSILDEFLRLDKYSKCDIQTVIHRKGVVICGEIRSSAQPNIDLIVRNSLKELGYISDESGLDPYKCSIETVLVKQSQDIARGVAANADKEQGAGDMGVVYGFATNETDKYLPLPHVLARKIALRVATIRSMGTMDFLMSDGKCQVTVEYLNDKPKRVDTVVLAVQHTPDADVDWMRMELTENVIKNVCGKWLDSNTKILINSSGRFVIGGPQADIGMSGSKMAAAAYGGLSHWGGNSFSGKDATKIDRTAALMARKAAISVIANGFAEKCEVVVGYAIGVADPVTIEVDTLGSGLTDEDQILKFVKENFSFKPADIIKEFGLLKPIYKDLSLNGHFGREDLPWEEV